MDNRLKLVWGNNPNTPLNAQNLSKVVEKYSEGDIIFYDEHDQLLKFRANTKLSFPTQQTNAFFNFDNTLVSHNSVFYPITEQNISYRIEYDKSIAIESGTTNKIVNGTFLSGLSGWTTSGTITTSTDGVEPGHSAQMGPLVGTTILEQTVNFTGDISGSISFYYKTTSSDFKVYVIGNPGAGQTYWDIEDPNPIWTTETYLSLPAAIEWTRVEIPNINVGTLPAPKEIKLRITGNTAGNICLIDHVQAEAKAFCSSYVGSFRTNPVLTYSPYMINPNEGLIDLEFIPKYFTGAEQIIFSVRVTGTDVFRLSIKKNLDNNIYVFFRIWDKNIGELLIQSDSIGAFTDIINQPQRIICSWNKDSESILHIFNNSSEPYTSILNSSFTPYTSTEIIEFKMCDTSFPAESILTGIKINSFSKILNEITAMTSEAINADENIYQVFENGNNNIAITPEMLEATSWPISTDFYLWMCKDGDECYLDLTTVELSPLGPDSKLIGGFKTDAVGNLLLNSLWDVAFRTEEIATTNRLVVTDKNSGDIVIDAGYDEIDEESFVHIYKNVEINSNISQSGNFELTSGYSKIDNIKIDGNTISSELDVLNLRSFTNIDIRPTSTGTVTITGTTATINANTGNINITGGTINITSSVKVNLNYVTIVDNIISTSANALYLQSFTGNDIVIGPSSGKVVINSSGSIYINGTYRQGINLYNNNSTFGVGVQTDSAYFRSAEHFAWYKGGSHNNAKYNAGGGSVLAVLTSGEAFSGTLSTTSRFYAAKVYNAIYNDVAECWIKDMSQNIEYGMIAVQTEQGVRPSQKRAEKGTVGIVSDSFGYLLGEAGFKDNLAVSPKVPIAIAGRVKVKTVGRNLSIGDLIVSYKNGLAIKANWVERIFFRERIIGVVDSIFENFCWVKV